MKAVGGSLLVFPGMFLQWLSQGQISASVHRVVLKSDGCASNNKLRLTMPLHIYRAAKEVIPIRAYRLYEHTVFDRSLAV